MHGSNRLGGNSLSDLLVFGRRAGLGAADYVRALAERPAVSDEAVDEAAKLALAPFDGPTNGDTPENPYTLHADLQQSMNDLVGIIRKDDEIAEALAKLERAAGALQACAVEGGRQFNPGWHLAIDLRNMLLVSECVAKAALRAHREPRRPHPRRPPGDGCRLAQHAAGVPRRTATDAVVPDVDGHRARTRSPMRPDLLELFELVRTREVLHRRRTGRAPGTERLRWLPTTRSCGCGAATTSGGELQDYTVEVNEGEVVLDIIHRLQATQTPRPRRAVELQGGQVRVVLGGDQRPAAAAVHDPDVDLRRGRDRHGDAAAHLPGDPRPGHRRVVQLREGPGDPVVHAAEGSAARRVPDAAGGRRSASQEFRKCIECFLCQNICHVVRDHEENKEAFAGPALPDASPSWTCIRWTPWTAGEQAQDEYGLGYCNITKCCTEVCPEHIKITDNALIPMKERVADRKYDPVVWLGNKLFRRGASRARVASRR